ncbi:MAG: type I-E CRISPR-associated protein Cas5/CasD [Glaciecola sp.]
MKTLILKTEGLSAYGLQTFDVHRRANHFSTRSAIVGLLAAALGITRTDQQALYELSEQITIAVQVNQAGEKMMDYHTVQNFRSPEGKIQKGTKPTYREYWCDSEHTFAISAESSLISQLEEAVKAPKFSLYQGRKCCPLTRPLFDGVVNESNPAIALKKLASKGQIFSDVEGENQVARLQIRDRLTRVPRKYAMRMIYVSGEMVSSEQELSNEFT